MTTTPSTTCACQHSCTEHPSVRRLAHRIGKTRALTALCCNGERPLRFGQPTTGADLFLKAFAVQRGACQVVAQAR